MMGSERRRLCIFALVISSSHACRALVPLPPAWLAYWDSRPRRRNGSYRTVTKTARTQTHAGGLGYGRDGREWNVFGKACCALVPPLPALADATGRGCVTNHFRPRDVAVSQADARRSGLMFCPVCLIHVLPNLSYPFTDADARPIGAYGRTSQQASVRLAYSRPCYACGMAAEPGPRARVRRTACTRRPARYRRTNSHTHSRLGHTPKSLEATPSCASKYTVYVPRRSLAHFLALLKTSSPRRHVHHSCDEPWPCAASRNGTSVCLPCFVAHRPSSPDPVALSIHLRHLSPHASSKFKTKNLLHNSSLKNATKRRRT